MGQRYLCSFPATNNASQNIASMYRGIVEKILQKFLPFRFNTVVIDTKNGIPNVYNTDNGYKLGRRYEEKEPLKPIIRFEFINKGNNYDDTQLGLYNLKRMASAHGFDNEMRGYIPFFKDIFDVKMWYSPVFTKTEININIILKSRDDQLAFANIIETNIDQHYGLYFDNTPVGFYLPRDLILSYRQGLFKSKLEELNNPEYDLVLRDKMIDGINEVVYEWLRMGSSGYIDAAETPLNDNTTDKLYDLLTFRNVFVKFEKFQIEEPEKRGKVIMQTSISSSGFLEFHSIMNFILDMPSFVNGNWLDREAFIIRDQNTEKDLIKYFATRYTYDLEKDPFFNNEENRNRFRCLHLEEDIKIDTPNELIDFAEDFLPEIPISKKFQLVYERMTEDEKRDYIHVSVYKQYELLTRMQDYFQDGKYISIIDPDESMPYNIALYIDIIFFAKKWTIISRDILNFLTKEGLGLEEADKEEIINFLNPEAEVNSGYEPKILPYMRVLANEIGNSRIIISQKDKNGNIKPRKILNYTLLYERFLNKGINNG